jgi:hypothetical protein
MCESGWCPAPVRCILYQTPQRLNALPGIHLSLVLRPVESALISENAMSQTASPCNSFQIAWFAALLAAPLFTSSIARADEACGNTTCPTGFVCKTYESTNCADVSMVDGKTASCETATTSYQCAPAPCSVDADCGVGMACFSSTHRECSGGTTVPTCAHNAPDCTTTAPDVMPESCTTIEVQQCVPRYLLPCTTPSDCGPGFTCEETIQMACSGSGGATSVEGTGANSSSAMDATPIDECTSTPTGQFACKLQLIACTTDAGCPAGFTCVVSPDGSCSSSSTGESSCTVADPPRLCMPPYADLVSRAASESDSNGSITAAESVLTPKASGADGASPAGPSDAASVSGGGCHVTRVANGLGSNLVPFLLAAGLALGLRRRRQS